MLATFSNPDPQKYLERNKSQKVLSKQIEEIVKHYAMPRGVCYEYSPSSDLIESLYQVQ
jgi:hypothetical protein